MRQAAKAAGVGIYHCFELGFACTDESMIQEGVRRLKKILHI
ncbi:hypothetical protein ABE067_14065 [Bacillus safensis]|nr:hypothetical protein [Bacillus safensis]MED0728402.1 hypothetical protein [Bacillus safensis]